MSRNINRVSNERNTKAKKTKAQSKENRDRCNRLLKALQKRSDDFVSDCEKFYDTSDKLVTFYETVDISASTLLIFRNYIIIYVYFWKQYIYLNDGICSFPYQLEECIDSIRTERNHELHELSNYCRLIINLGGTNNFTDTSVEGIYNVYASYGSGDDDLLMHLEATVKDKLAAAGKNITNSVKQVTDKLNKMKVTKKHYGLTPLFTKKIKGNIDIRVNFVYKYDEHELKVGSDLIKNFSIITQEKLRIFNDSIKLARNLLSPNRKIAVLTNKQATTVPPACKCYLVASVLYITSILHPNIVITSLGTASNSVAIELSLDSNLLPPLIAKGEQNTHYLILHTILLYLHSHICSHYLYC